MFVVNQLLQGPRRLINICLFVSGEFLPAYDTFIPELTPQPHSHTVTQLRCLCLCFWAAHTVPQLAGMRGMAVIRF